MTLETQTPRVVITGNGTRGPYSLVDATSQPIRFVSTSHVRLVRYSSTTDEEGTTLVENTDYTIGGTQDARTFTLADSEDVLASTERIVADRNQSYTQDLSLSNGGAFGAIALMNRLDKYGEYLQELKTKVDRKIEAAALDSTPSTFPLKANALEGDLLGFDASKNLVPLTPADIGIDALLLGSGWSTVLGLPAAGILDNLAGVRFVATYAALTALTTATGLSDNSIYCTYGRSAEEDGGFGFWRYDSGSTASADSGTVLAIDGGGAGRFFRLYEAGVVRADWFGSLSSSFAATLALAITAAGTGGKVIIPKASYSMTAGVTLLAKQTLVFEGAPEFTEDYPTAANKVSRAFNGTAFNMDAAGCGIEGLNFDGVGATYTGAAVRIAGGQQQWMENCNIDDNADECLLFVGADAGERFVAHACHFRRTTTTNPAIVLPTTIDTAGNRSFLDCDSFGGCLARINKSINTHIHNGRFATLDFAGSTSVGGDLRCTITGCRIATGGSALTIEGSGGVITGCVLAGNITLGTSSSRWHVGPNAMPGFTITDNSTATGDNVNEVFGAAEFAITPNFKADSADPAKGDGTLTGRVSRNGRILKVDIQFAAGSTSTFGTGDWYFTLPSPYSGFVAKADAVGSIRILDSGTQYYEGSCVITAGSGRIYLFVTQTVTATSPMTWANNDTLKLTIEFEIS